MFNFIEYWILMKHEVTRTRNRRRAFRNTLEMLDTGTQSAQPFNEVEENEFLRAVDTLYVLDRSKIDSIAYRRVSVSVAGFWRFDTSNRDLSFL